MAKPKVCGDYSRRVDMVRGRDVWIFGLYWSSWLGLRCGSCDKVFVFNHYNHVRCLWEEAWERMRWGDAHALLGHLLTKRNGEENHPLFQVLLLSFLFWTIKLNSLNSDLQILLYTNCQNSETLLRSINLELPKIQGIKDKHMPHRIRIFIPLYQKENLHSH
jgi:hypothetical protein